MVSTLQEQFSKRLARQRKASKTKKQVSRAENSIRKNLNPLTELTRKAKQKKNSPRIPKGKITNKNTPPSAMSAQATKTAADRAMERQKTRRQEIAKEAKKSRKK